MHASRLLIVEDHPILADALRMNVLQLLPRAQCLLAYDLASGLEMLLEHSPIDLVVLDLNLPDSQTSQAESHPHSAMRSGLGSCRSLHRSQKWQSMSPRLEP